jgi:MYXO-CTERM domain-containing protein
MSRRHLPLTAGVLALGLAGACEQRSPVPELRVGERRIISGSPSSVGDFAPVGALIARAQFGSFEFGTLLCTGTLIAPDVVLTAAHCTQNPLDPAGDRFEYYFTFTEDLSATAMGSGQIPPRSYRIAELRGHEDFDLQALGNMPLNGLDDFSDVGLMFLAEPVVDVEPAVIAETDDDSAVVAMAEVDIVGYGQREVTNQQSAGIKQHARSFINEVGPAEMQIGDRPPTAQKCHGDSGGPTFLEVDDGLLPRQRVVGITSRAYNSTDDCNIGGVDMRVDAYRAWIVDQMIDACTRGVRTVCPEGGAPATPGMGGPHVPDAGPRPLPDAGTPAPVDAGFVDSGVEPDAGVAEPDAGSAPADAGSPPDAGSTGGTGGSSGGSPRGADEGCGCAVAGPRSTSTPAWPLAILGLALALRRRR